MSTPSGAASASISEVASPVTDGAVADKEAKRRKQLKRMNKILGGAWEASDAVFRDDGVLSLAAIGSKLDRKEYRVGKHGWEDFCKDLGGVFNYHIVKKTKQADLAKQTLDKILPLLPAESLQQVASTHVPTVPQLSASSKKKQTKTTNSSSSSSKKRPASSISGTAEDDHDNDNDNRYQQQQQQQQTHGTFMSSNSSSPARRQRHNTTRELADREDRALSLLRNFVTERGGNVRLVDGFTCRVTKKAANAYNVNFYSAANRRFRSMLEVGRHFGLVEAASSSTSSNHTTSGAGNNNKTGSGGSSNKHSIRRRAASKESEAEKRRLRRELDRLRKVLRTASKALDAHASSSSATTADNAAASSADATAPGVDHHDDDDMDDSEPVEDYLLADDTVTRLTCAAARIPDIDGFPLVPQHCIPDVLMAWDFLCTFSRALSLTPIALDDFAAALVYTPPEGQLGDDVAAPPVYLAEAHLGLLKLLLQDAYSDDWWWSTLETVEEEEMPQQDYLSDADRNGQPVIKVDMEALLSEDEDPLITISWFKALESVGNGTAVAPLDQVKVAIKTALGVVSNKWVHAYLRKTLEASKSADPMFMTRAVLFLINCVRQARPDLVDRTARSEKLRKAKEKVVSEASELMSKLNASAPVVAADEAISDVEYESEESDDEDATGNAAENIETKQVEAYQSMEIDEADKKLSTVIPPRPTPTIVDLLLPPTKPGPNSEFVNPFTWSAMVGATAHRMLHRKKRLLNEVDDYVRAQREMKPPTCAERHERESLAASRLLTECEEHVNGASLTDKAIQHLCNGGHYLLLSTTERLCILRLMIEAAYDTARVYEVVSGNIKQRQSAMKALEVEQRKAKKDEKEKAVADVAAARERLALEAKERFLDEKRDEIRKLNEKSKELSDDVIESLTEEDIVDFDEDIKADFLALPTPDSFNKTEVKNMVARMLEEAAFDCDSLRVLSLDELLQRERRHLEEMEGQFLGFGGEEALLDPSLDRETIRSIERLKKDIEKAKEQAEKLPALRERAIDQLNDAMQDGTIKVLRSAITAGKRAKLSGADEETGGVWAVDSMRDAALELDSAKANKRVIDAQRDLIAKRNKCFIRTEPMGIDRFANRFWSFDNDEDGHFWVEADYTLGESNSAGKPPTGFLDLRRSGSQIAFGASEYEEDFMGTNELAKPDEFRMFSRREHHHEGFAPNLVKRNWGCQATEASVRAVIKLLNSKGLKEGDLKTKLKESLEHTVGNDEKHESADAVATTEETALENGEPVGTAEDELASGDSVAFKAAKDAATLSINEGAKNAESLLLDILDGLESGIRQNVRVRQVIDGGSKEDAVARYENGLVVGWKSALEEVEAPTLECAIDDEDEDMLQESKTLTLEVPYWKVATERGHTIWLKGEVLLQSICRFEKWTRGKGYFEDDAAFFAYRNHLGKYLGRAQEAPYSCSPNSFAALMVKREGELYSKLKIRSYDNNWGGKSGARALWTNSMKDYAFDFATVKQGLVTLENAFFELTGEFAEYAISTDAEIDAKALLEDSTTRVDIELETIEKDAPGLWNSKTTRLVFLEIVASSKTTGVLALCLDLLCRNTTAYLRKYKLLNTKADDTFAADDYVLFDEPSGNRRTRGTNLWQRQKKTVNYEEFF